MRGEFVKFLSLRGWWLPGGGREGGSQGEKGSGKDKKWPGNRQDQKWSILYRIVVSGELGCDGVLFGN